MQVASEVGCGNRLLGRVFPGLPVSQQTAGRGQTLLHTSWIINGQILL